MSATRTPWAIQAMSPDARTLAARLDLTAIGGSPKGPWVVRHPALAAELRGRDVDALVLAAAKEISDGR